MTAESTGLIASLAPLMADASSDDARLSQLRSLTLASVRVRDDAVARVARVLEVSALPAPNEHCRTAFGDCLWLRPDEWLVAAAPNVGDSVLAALGDAVGDEDGAVVDISASRVVFELSGPATRDVLASCCPLDLHPRAFTQGRCAQSLIAKVPVLLQLVDGTPRWRLYIRPSLADYVVRWLVDGMTGAGWPT